MKYLKIIMLGTMFALVASCSPENAEVATQEAPAEKLFADVREGVQALSFVGTPLVAGEPSQGLLDNLAEAKANYDADPMDAMNIIWYGRRVGYTGYYRRAIEIFSEGIEKHPTDARMYRHRGHRYISIREIDRAVADYEMAAGLIEGTEDKIEPDGAPNPQGIFLSTTHSNIYYHLGLSYYLKQDWVNALAAFQAGQDLGLNDDNIVSAGHWIYMINRRMGNEEAAQASLHNIERDMEVIENMSYHNLTLMYKSIIPAEQFTDVDPNDSDGAAIAYGVANWFLYNGEPERAYALMERLMETKSWSAFGFIAAEMDLSTR